MCISGMRTNHQAQILTFMSIWDCYDQLHELLRVYDTTHSESIGLVQIYCVWNILRDPDDHVHARRAWLNASRLCDLRNVFDHLADLHMNRTR